MLMDVGSTGTTNKMADLRLKLLYQGPGTKLTLNKYLPNRVTLYLANTKHHQVLGVLQQKESIWTGERVYRGGAQTPSEAALAFYIRAFAITASLLLRLPVSDSYS